jgi:serine/threonine-protein kinase
MLEKLGPFTLERLLGRGGMGAVYVGVNEATGERAAIKLLSAHLADDEGFRERFKQEIETLKRLLHPNIVQLHGYGEEEGHLYYVMELVEGRSLQEELAAGRRFTWREVVRAGIAIAGALKHAHDRGIIHRDLKPANLLIDSQDHIKLTDFGIAKLYGGANVTVAGGVLGTADYMAPEQAKGEGITSRCDLYALGSVLYALLTGKPPFAGKSVAEVVTALQKDPPVPPRRLAPDTPPEFEQIVLQLLEKDAQKRIPTALAVANRLKAMEHALSLETRVGDAHPEQPSEAPPRVIGPTDKTELVDPASQATAAFPSEEEYRLASEPTEVAGAGGAAASSSRTSLSTQAGKKTGAGSDSGRGTHAEANAAGQPVKEEDLPSRMSRFVMVSEQELRGRKDAEESPWVQWVVAGVLGIVGLTVAIGAVAMATRQPSADRLYGQIMAAANQGETSALVGVEAQMQAFREQFAGDPRAGEVNSLADKLAQYRLEKKAVQEARRGTMNVDASPVERAYNESLSLLPSEPEAALERFEAVVAVFEGNQVAGKSGDESHWVELAREQAERLRPVVERLIQEQRFAARRQLERADDLAKTDPQAALRIWRGIVTLFGEKPWAQELVANAQQRIAAATGDAGVERKATKETKDDH